MMNRTFAPAKINLTLHITGQRADGYHLLDSLVAFADVGDRITVVPAETTTLEVTGPMAEGVPTDDTNLALRAVRLFDMPVSVKLDKHLPVSSGMGGGSSDAAATLIAMAETVGISQLPEGAAELGADVRVCFERRAARMRGIGDEVQPIDWMPELYAVLANPGFAVSTPAVFAALESRDNMAMPKRVPRWRGLWSAIDWIGQQRNDMQAAAIGLHPEIGALVERMAALDGARLARMSGSGPTCFALFEEQEAAQMAADELAAEMPGKWVTYSTLR